MGKKRSARAAGRLPSAEKPAGFCLSRAGGKRVERAQKEGSLFSTCRVDFNTIKKTSCVKLESLNGWLGAPKHIIQV